MSASSTSTTSKPAQSLGIACVLALLTALVFGPVVRNDYVNLDDPTYVTEPHLQSGLTGATVKWAFTTWHPVTWLSFLAERQLWGVHTNVSHGVNLFLHCVNVALVFLCLQRLTGARWRSVMVALLFALHPQQVEAVVWVAERKGVLSVSFGLLALIAYMAYAKARGEGRGAMRAKWIWYGTALICFACGLMSKPSLVFWPLVWLALDAWPLHRMRNAECGMQNAHGNKTTAPHPAQSSSQCAAPHPASGHLLPKAEKAQSPIEAERAWQHRLYPLILEKIPFLALSIVAAWLTTHFQQQAGALQTLESVSVANRLENSVAALAHYLFKIVWPTQLAVPYPREITAQLTLVAGGAILLVGGSVLAWRERKRSPEFFVGPLWFGLLLLPVIGLLQVGAQTVADRYAYLPSIGIFLAFTWWIQSRLKSWCTPPIIQVLLAMVVMVPLVILARRQIGYWQNSETLFTHATHVTANNWLAHYNLASDYEQQGRAADALQHYLEAARIKPNYADAHNNAGVLLAKSRRYDEALACFAAALQARPDFAEVRGNMAQTYLNQAKELNSAGKTAEAKQALQQAISAAPNHAEAHLLLGTLLARAGELAAAIPELETAVRLKPEDVMAHFTFGKALANAGQFDAARQQFQEALRLKPGATPILQALESLPPDSEPKP